MYARMLLIGTLILASLGWAGQVNAEGRCPPGSYPIGSETGVMGCAPIPGAGGESSAGIGPPTQGNRVKMVPQWVAFARSPNGQVIGWSVRQHKQKAADKQALKTCNKRSGEQCEVIASFTERCAYALQHYETGQFEVVFRSDNEVAMASEIARQTCPNGCRPVHFECARAFNLYGSGPDQGPNWSP